MPRIQLSRTQLLWVASDLQTAVANEKFIWGAGQWCFSPPEAVGIPLPKDCPGYTSLHNGSAPSDLGIDLGIDYGLYAP